MPFKSYGVSAARAADDKKASNISLLELGPDSSLTDYLLIVSADSKPQINAVEHHIREILKDEGLYAAHREGPASPKWRVLDFGGLMVHIMHPEAREFYQLDKLYIDAKRLDWEPRAVKKSATKKKKTTAKKAAKKKTVKKAAAKKKKTKKKKK